MFSIPIPIKNTLYKLKMNLYSVAVLQILFSYLISLHIKKQWYNDTIVEQVL